VVVVGLTVTFGLAPKPLDQLNVVPGISELTDSSELSFRQISVGVALAVIVGNGWTVTVTSAVPVHPSIVVPVTEYVVVVVGITVTLGLVPKPFDQLNVVPGISELTVSSELSFRQISVGVAVTVIFGNGWTVTVTSAVPVQPSGVVPVTEYVVVAVGLTVTFGFVPNPFDQLNVVPGISELTVSSELSFRQISVGVALAVIFGNGFTVTVTVAVPVHPAVLVPVTVYVVVALSVTVLLAPVPNPPDQLYVLAPLAVNSELAPEHIAAGLADADTVGNGFTVNVTVAVPVHPAALVPVTVYVVVELGVTVMLAVVPPVLQL
jgi:hypothetical protein